MDRDHFIMTVYCLVCAHHQALARQQHIRRGGFAPALTDEEVITIEICGAYLKGGTDKDIFAYFRAHDRAYVPHLRDRSRFVRQAASLWRVKELIQRRLTVVSGQVADPVQVIDTLPLPVCGYTRSGRDRCVKPLADDGHCAAKKLDYYGFKRGLRIARSGMIIAYPLLPARPHDIQLLDDLVAGFAGTVPADKGFIDTVRQALLAERHAVLVITPPRTGMTTPHPRCLLRACARIRTGVETVGSPLTERFAVARIRVHDLWHDQHRLIRTILAHTIGVFLTLQQGRSPLDLDGLVTI